jgi:dipeptide/tripeptide permease
MDLINKFLDELQANRLAMLLLGMAIVVFIIMLFAGASSPKIRKNLSIGFFVLGLAFLLVLSPMKTKIQEIGNFLPGAGETSGGQ